MVFLQRHDDLGISIKVCVCTHVHMYEHTCLCISYSIAGTWTSEERFLLAHVSEGFSLSWRDGTTSQLSSRCQ